MRYAMAIDLNTCIGCHTCSVACKSNNNLPNNVWFNKVVTDGGAYMNTSRGTYPTDLHKSYWPISCQHCSNPACVEVCPTGASFQREDGIVVSNTEDCIGCGSCIAACPYDVRTLYEEEPEYYVDFPLGDFDAPQHNAGTVGKCNFCVNRLERDAKPACMELCPGRSRYWGNMDDPQSTISQFLEGKDYEVLLEEEGTIPNVFFVR